jgi:MFS family permease
VAERPSRDLSLLITGNAVSALGNAVYILAVTLLLKELTQSTLAIGAFQFVALFPGFLLSPVIGALIDRSSRRRIVVAADLARGGLMILAAVALLFPTLRSAWFILVVAFLAGLGHGFFVPAVQAWLPSIVPRERLPRATTLRVASSQIANLAGNAAGGVLFVVLGAPALFAVNGVTFLISGIQESFIRRDRPEAPRAGGTAEASRPSVLAAAREGLRQGLSDPLIRLLLISQAGLFAISPVLTLSLPFIVIDELGMSEAAVGYFLATGLVGAIAAFALLRGRSPGVLLSMPLVQIAYGAIGAGFLLLAVTTRPVSLAIVALLSGAAAAAVYLFATTWLQTRTPASVHGRLFALFEAANSAVAPTAYLVAGLGLELVGAEMRWTLFAVLGGAALVWAAVLARKMPRLTRHAGGEASDDEALENEH